MIRLEDLAHVLGTIRNAVAFDIRPEVQSSHVKGEVGAIVMMLDRITTALRTGEDIAAARLQDWQQIRAGFEDLAIAPLADPAARRSGFMGSAEELRAGIDEIQEALRPDGAVDALAHKLKAHDPGTEAWYARAVAALADLGEASEPIVNSGESKANGDSSPAAEADRLQSALSAYLQRRFPALPGNIVDSFRISPGGHVKQTAIFSLRPNDVLPRNLVLRRDLPNSITGTSVTDEYPIIERAFGIGLPVPKPILVEPDPSVLDGRFMIMTEVVNAVPAGTYFPEERRYAPRNMGPEFGKEVAAVLARLHTATRSASAGPVADRAALVRNSYEEWRRLPQQPFSLGAELAFAWLFSHPLPPNRPHCMTHGDVGVHNMMVRDGHLAALLDWELSHPGDPAEDLAQCRMMLLPDVMPWKDFVREYVAAGGDEEACEATSVAHYCVWTYIKHGVMNATLRSIYLTGARDDLIAASVATHYYYRLVVQYQARALQIAIDAGRPD
jgi:aminoglycoside phosphotransferase (APT) family kinase protein